MTRTTKETPYPSGRRPGTCRMALAAVACAASSMAVHAQADPGSDRVDPTVSQRPARVRLGFEHIGLPSGEGLGLVGTTYLIDLGRGLSIGPAVYGALSGQRGGLFTLGTEVAWRTRLGGPLEVEAGYFVGGGGGAAAPVGGGLMLRPHVDLLWNFGSYKAGISASQVRFPNGQIDSKQVGLVLSADTDFSFIAPNANGTLRSSFGASGMGFDRVIAVGGFYRPPAGTLRTNGQAMGPKLYYVGARFEHFFDRDEHVAGIAPYWGVEGAGAAGGGVAGYAEYLATLGAEVSPFGPRSAFGGRVGVGMAGGGQVATGGGLLVKASVYGSLVVAGDVSIGLEGGYARAPQGNFRAPYASVNLNWALDSPGSQRYINSLQYAGPAVRTEWVAGLGTYRASRSDGTTRSLQNVILKGNRFISDNLYVTAQANSAYTGDAGGYTVGLIGAGVQTPLWSRMQLSGEVLVGAGGGGGVATGGGALVQPMAYLSYALSNSFQARIGLGHIRSSGGQLSSTVTEVVLAMPFGVTPRP